MSASPFVSAAAPDAAVTAAIAAACERLRDEATEMLAALVRIPSMMGHEAGAQKIMAGAFADLGLAVETFAVEDAAIRDLPGYSPALVPYDETRRNVVGTHRPKAVKGRSLIFNGHIDVIPEGAPQNWEHGPWSADISDGKLYGRGTADMKSGVAAMTMAVRAIRACGVKLKGDLILEYVMDEELSGNGTLACVMKGYRADAGICCETSSMKVQPGSIGRIWFEILVRGKAAGIQRRYEGVNAIDFG